MNWIISLIRAYEKHMMIILNPSPFDNALENCDLSKISLFLMNEIEGFQITGEKEPDKILTKVKALYPKAKVVLTLGGDGSVYQDETGIYRQGIFKVKAVDTIRPQVIRLQDILFLLLLMGYLYRTDWSLQQKHPQLQFPDLAQLHPFLFAAK